MRWIAAQATGTQQIAILSEIYGSTGNVVALPRSYDHAVVVDQVGGAGAHRSEERVAGERPVIGAEQADGTATIPRGQRSGADARKDDQ